jgi:hypothetical protein
VRDLLELSGLRQQLEWMAVGTRAQLQARLGSLQTEERAAVDRVAADSFGAERMQALVSESVSAHLDEAKLGQVLAWYRTPAGRKITAAELVAGMPHAQDELAAFARAREARPAEAARLERLRRLEAVVGGSEFTFDVVLAVADGLRRGVEPFVSVERRRVMASLDREAASGRVQAVEQIRATTLVTAEFAYRGVSDDELDAYLSFLASPAGRWLTAALHRSLLHAIRTSTEEAIVAIAGIVPPQRWGRGRAPQVPEVPPKRL